MSLSSTLPVVFCKFNIRSRKILMKLLSMGNVVLHCSSAPFRQRSRNLRRLEVRTPVFSDKHWLWGYGLPQYDYIIFEVARYINWCNWHKKVLRVQGFLAQLTLNRRYEYEISSKRKAKALAKNNSKWMTIEGLTGPNALGPILIRQ